MFATLTGPLPDRPDLFELQVEAGVGLLTDGVVGDPAGGAAAIVAAWRELAARAGDHPVKALLPGPATAPPAAIPPLATAIRALAEAGCPLVEVAEPRLPGGDRHDAGPADGTDPAGVPDPAGAITPAAFLEAHLRLAEALPADPGIHLHLALGAGAERLGPDAAARLAALPYRSVGFDLIGGPDDWRVAVRLPADRGVVAGALDLRSPGAGDLETMVWAARYAASSAGRGLARVGLTNAPGLDLLPPGRFELKVRLLGEAARLAAAPRSELERILDPRAIGPF